MKEVLNTILVGVVIVAIAITLIAGITLNSIEVHRLRQGNNLLREQNEMLKETNDINKDGKVNIEDYTENRIKGYEIIAEVLDITVEEAVEISD